MSDVHSLSSSHSHSYLNDLSTIHPDNSTTTKSELSRISSSLSPNEKHLTSSPVMTMKESEKEQTETLTPQSHLTTPSCKFVIDNIDSTVKPRYMREDSQNQSLPYMQVYAVRDRIDFSDISKAPPATEKNLYSFLPTSDEYQILKENMAILVAHILVDHISFFSEDFKGLVTRHIPHQYSAQMSQKSEVVRVFFFYICG